MDADDDDDFLLTYAERKARARSDVSSSSTSASHSPRACSFGCVGKCSGHRIGRFEYDAATNKYFAVNKHKPRRAIHRSPAAMPSPQRPIRSPSIFAYVQQRQVSNGVAPALPPLAPLRRSFRCVISSEAHGGVAFIPSSDAIAVAGGPTAMDNTIIRVYHTPPDRSVTPFEDVLMTLPTVSRVASLHSVGPVLLFTTIGAGGECGTLSAHTIGDRSDSNVHLVVDIPKRSVYHSAVAPDQQHVAIAATKAAMLFDINKRSLRRLLHSRSDVVHVTFADEHVILSALRSGGIAHSDIRAQTPSLRLLQPSTASTNSLSPIKWMSVVPNNSHLLLTNRVNSTIQLQMIDLRMNRSIDSLQYGKTSTLQPSNDNISVTFNDFGDNIVTVDAVNGVRTYNVRTADLISQVALPQTVSASITNCGVVTTWAASCNRADINGLLIGSQSELSLCCIGDRDEEK